MIPAWFLYVSGFSLMLLGLGQMQARPHEKGDSFYKRFVNMGTLWSLCCIVVGTLVVLVGLGYIEQPGPRAPEAPATKSRSRSR